MAFEKTCALCNTFIENTDQFVDLNKENFNLNKLIENNSSIAHLSCFKKSFTHKGNYEQLRLFK